MFRRAKGAYELLLPGLLAGVVVMVIGDCARMLPQAGRFLEGPLDVLALLLLEVGVYGLTAASGLLLVTIILLAATCEDPRALIVRFKRWAKDAFVAGKHDPGLAAKSWALIPALVLTFGLLYRSLVLLVRNFNTPRLIALAGVGCAAGAILTGILGFAVVNGLLVRMGGRNRVMAWIVRARVVGVVYGMGLAAGVVAAVLVERRLFKDLDGWALYLPLVALGVWFAVSVVRGGASSAGGLHKAAASSLLVVATLVGLFWAPRYSRPRALALEAGRDVAQLMRFWMWITDFDGDGFSSFLGGGDCAPFDKEIHPMALDVPGNGVDEDCFGGDLEVAPDRPRPFRGEGVPNLHRPDIVLFTMDGVRADMVGARINGRPVTPNLDSFAKNALVFTDAMAEASWTMPSFVSLFTGRYASELQGFFGATRFVRVPRDVPNLFQGLSAAGYTTVAVTSGLQLDKMGLHRGLERWKAQSRGPGGSHAMKVVELALKELEARGDRPLFLWIHAIDPHYPYEAPRKCRKFGGDAKDLYAAEVHYVDAAFGRLLKFLEESPRWGRTVVMVFSDHGEAFGEHGRKWHGHTTYTEEIHVPLILRIPGIRGGRVDRLVSLLDVLPTLWDLAGVRWRPILLRGTSLLGAVRGTGLPADRAMVAEQTRYTREISLITSRFKLRLNLRGQYVELFDRKNDPREQHNVADIYPEETYRLREQLSMVLYPVLKTVSSRRPKRKGARSKRVER